MESAEDRSASNNGSLLAVCCSNHARRARPAHVRVSPRSTLTLAVASFRLRALVQLGIQGFH